MAIAILVAFLLGSAVARSPFQIEAPRVCPFKADMVCIVDASGTAAEFNLLLRSFIEVVRTQRFDFGGTRFSTVTLTGSVPTAEFYLDTYSTIDEVLDALQRIPHRRGPHMGKEGLEFVNNKMLRSIKGDRPDVEDAVFYLAGSPSITDMSQQAEKMRESGIQIWAIGAELVGLEGSRARKQLKDITGGGNRYIEATSFNELVTKTFAEKVANVVCPP